MDHGQENRQSESKSCDRNTLDGFTQGYVRKKARQIAGRYGFRRSDRDDIEQELYLKLSKHLDGADPGDPKWRAFVAVTVDRRIASLIRDGVAEKRDHRRTGSLHVVIGSHEGEPVTIADTVTVHNASAQRADRHRTESDYVEVQVDVTESIATLSEATLRELCERLKHDSVSKVARDMGIPRTTLNSWITKLRSRFENRGLREYVQPSSSTR
ncbi:MAG: sigma-70 family RNA polymerase sigma factor [Pirellulales bacterium]|nr:sigma-70 family RNA polymerase sigma factor [Pirellulales bacterium]